MKDNKAKSEEFKEHDTRLITGRFSRKQAAQFIQIGVAHIHSSAVGHNNIDAKMTRAALSEHKILRYQWEKITRDTKTKYITNSQNRKSEIESIITDLGIKGKFNLKDKTEIILEELISNAIFHSYKSPEGHAKYPRNSQAELAPSERIKIQYHYSNLGVWLKLTDLAGTLTLEKISNSLERCYKKNPEQIETKDSGAGLGLYFIFEAVTHLKIVSVPNKLTTFSCLISEKHSNQSNYFSFNFFKRAKT